MKIQDTQTKYDELVKYQALVLAAINYQIQALQTQPSPGFDNAMGLEKLKEQVEDHFMKGRLSILKRWYRDVTEGLREGYQFHFNAFAKEMTGYTINIFEDHFARVEKVIAKGKISTEKQYYDIKSMVDSGSRRVSMLSFVRKQDTADSQRSVPFNSQANAMARPLDPKRQRGVCKSFEH